MAWVLRRYSIPSSLADHGGALDLPRDVLALGATALAGGVNVARLDASDALGLHDSLPPGGQASFSGSVRSCISRKKPVVFASAPGSGGAALNLTARSAGAGRTSAGAGVAVRRLDNPTWEPVPPGATVCVAAGTCVNFCLVSAESLKCHPQRDSSSAYVYRLEVPDANRDAARGPGDPDDRLPATATATAVDSDPDSNDLLPAATAATAASSGGSCEAGRTCTDDGATRDSTAVAPAPHRPDDGAQLHAAACVAAPVARVLAAPARATPRNARQLRLLWGRADASMTRVVVGSSECELRTHQTEAVNEWQRTGDLPDMLKVEGGELYYIDLRGADHRMTCARRSGPQPGGGPQAVAEAAGYSWLCTVANCGATCASEQELDEHTSAVHGQMHAGGGGGQGSGSNAAAVPDGRQGQHAPQADAAAAAAPHPRLSATTGTGPAATLGCGMPADVMDTDDESAKACVPADGSRGERKRPAAGGQDPEADDHAELHAAPATDNGRPNKYSARATGGNEKPTAARKLCR